MIEPGMLVRLSFSDPDYRTVRAGSTYRVSSGEIWLVTHEGPLDGVVTVSDPNEPSNAARRFNVCIDRLVPLHPLELLAREAE